MTKVQKNVAFANRGICCVKQYYAMEPTRKFCGSGGKMGVTGAPARKQIDPVVNCGMAEQYSSSKMSQHQR